LPLVWLLLLGTLVDIEHTEKLSADGMVLRAGIFTPTT
jgi:hypothetical protein